MHLPIVILSVILLAAMIFFAAMGTSRSKRSRWLSRKASEVGLRFSPEDIFNAPRRYSQFAPVRAGHSAQANNLLYGHKDGVSLRAFDFRYEIGHGTKRLTKNYHLIVVETGVEIPSVILWNDLDIAGAPLDVHGTEEHVDGWICLGFRPLADILSRRCLALAQDGLSMQTCGSLLMFCLPNHRRHGNYAGYLEAAVSAAKDIAAWGAAPPNPAESGKGKIGDQKRN